MNKLKLFSLQKEGLGEIGKMLDCIELPLAYIVSKYKTEKFFYYILASYCCQQWYDKNEKNSFNQRTNLILADLGLKMKPIKSSNKEKLIEEIQKSIDNGNPVLLLFDYFEMFYEEKHYLKYHIPHGVVLSGYDEKRRVFTLQESAHMNFTTLYPLQLTYDIVLDILNKSGKLFQERKYFTDSVYMFEQSMEELKEFSSIGFLKKYIERINTKQSALVEEIAQFDMKCFDKAQGMSDFKRRFSTLHRVFFEFFERVFKNEGINITKAYSALKEKYLAFYETLTAQIIKKHLKGEELTDEEVAQYIAKMKELDQELYNMLKELLCDKGEYKNHALVSKVTASSESFYFDMVFSADKLIDGVCENYSYNTMWANAEWDKEPWVKLQLSKPTEIKRFIMYHFLIYPVCSYVIEASEDDKQWKQLKKIENNKSAVTVDEICGTYQYFRVRFTKPSAIDNAARICQIELWG